MKNENHCGIIARVSVVAHPDKEVHSLAVGTVLNETIIVSKSTPNDAVGIYFPCDLQISECFAQANDLLRRKDPETGKQAGGMFDANRKVRAQTFKGIKSYGFWAPLSYLEKCGVDISVLKEGDLIDKIGDIEICCKYESPEQKRAKAREQKKMTLMQKIKAKIFAKEKAVTLFPEHKDTSHFLRNLHQFKVGDEIIISCKQEGTSQRFAYNWQLRPRKWYERLISKIGIHVDNRELRRYNGTRRVTLTETSAGGYFSESWRAKVAERILPYLEPHQHVYAEICGYEGQRTIAPKQEIKDKELRKQYGPKMVYTYGCPEGEFEIFVYRMSYVLESGKEIDMPWDNVKSWCDNHNIKTVPILARFIYDGDLEKLKKIVEELSDGPDPIDPRHIREGVCIRINGIEWKVYKQKGWNYRNLAGFNMEQTGFVDPEDVS